MATPFAALEVRLGSSVLARLSNATATLAAASVDGIFSQRAVDAGLGSTAMVARDVTFVCDEAEAAAAAFVPGATLSIAYQGASADWDVDTITPLRDGTGHTEIVFKAAT